MIGYVQTHTGMRPLPPFLFKGGKKSKTPAPLPPVTPAPEEDPVVVEENDKVKDSRKKRKGTKSLRIDRTINQTPSNGLNLPS